MKWCKKIIINKWDGDLMLIEIFCNGDLNRYRYGGFNNECSGVCDWWFFSRRWFIW